MPALPDLTPEIVDIFFRLVTAVLVGMVLGLNRDLKGKPSGARTLGLVALGAAMVAIAGANHPGMAGHPDAMSRVIQGIIQGVMAGVGFIGAGMILHDRTTDTVRNLTTAATVWVTAALGIACGLAAWPVVWIAVGMALTVLLLGSAIERLVARLFGQPVADRDARS